MDFNALHHQPQPLLVANVWDASSALAAEQAGYRALGTSSAAIAAMLGYDDGEGMCFDELLFIVTRIRAVTDLPLSVDLEAGYSDTTDGIANHIHRLAASGVVGINLEDSHVVNGVRQLDDAREFADRLQLLRQMCSGIFLNVRTDTFLLNTQDALRETLSRGRRYAASGADGFFVPCMSRSEDIATIAREIALPLNVMCIPELADFATLAELGVRRISMGNFVHSAIQSKLIDLMHAIRSRQTFEGLFGDENNR